MLVMYISGLCVRLYSIFLDLYLYYDTWTPEHLFENNRTYMTRVPYDSKANIMVCNMEFNLSMKTNVVDITVTFCLVVLTISGNLFVIYQQSTESC